MQGRQTKRSRSQKIFNIKAGGGAGDTGTALNARIIYKNISLAPPFLNQLDKILCLPPARQGGGARLRQGGNLILFTSVKSYNKLKGGADKGSALGL